MKETVIIKSFPNGIALRLDPDLPFGELLEEVRYKFSQARNFFGNVSMVLSIEGRDVSGPEEIRILETIQESSDLRIICIVSRDEAANKSYIRALAHTEKKLADESEGQFFRGDLKNGDVLETDNSIVVLGNIYPGCAVISAKNVIILGGLYGEAYAGGNGREGAFIAALEMTPERIKIGDFKYKPGTKQPKWKIRTKAQPKIAYVKNDRIVFEALTKDLLDTF